VKSALDETRSVKTNGRLPSSPCDPISRVDQTRSKSGGVARFDNSSTGGLSVLELYSDQLDEASLSHVLAATLRAAMESSSGAYLTLSFVLALPLLASGFFFRFMEVIGELLVWDLPTDNQEQVDALTRMFNGRAIKLVKKGAGVNTRSPRFRADRSRRACVSSPT
jgi:hypothetical protein